MQPRRRLLRAVGTAVAWGSTVSAAALVSGCGFTLRSAAALPFDRLMVEGVAPNSLLGQELRRQFGDRVRFVTQRSEAQAVLSIEAANREKLVTGLTSTALVREMVLRLRFRFRLSAPDGRILIDSTELLLQRDLSTNETVALAKAREEEEIFRVLERDAVLQMIRRLESPQARQLVRGG